MTDMLNENDLLQNGFNKEQYGIYQKEINGRIVNCYKHPKDGGYWVCEIDNIRKPARYDNLASIKELEKFIEYTCNSEIDNVIIRPSK